MTRLSVLVGLNECQTKTDLSLGIETSHVTCLLLPAMSVVCLHFLSRAYLSIAVLYHFVGDKVSLIHDGRLALCGNFSYRKVQVAAEANNDDRHGGSESNEITSITH